MWTESTQLLGDRGAPEARFSSHPRNSLFWPRSQQCELAEVKQEGPGAGRREGDQDRDCPEGWFQAHFLRPQG